MILSHTTTTTGTYGSHSSGTIFRFAPPIFSNRLDMNQIRRERALISSAA